MICNEGYYPMPDGLKPVYFRSWTPVNPAGFLVCIHGAGGNSADFTFLATQLSDPARERVYGVVAFDAPGSGLSAANPSFARFSVQLQALQWSLRQSSGPVALLASSAGAIATLTCLYQNLSKAEFMEVPVILAEPAIGFDEETRAYITECNSFLGKTFLNLDTAEAAWDASPFGDVLFENPTDKRNFIRGRLIPTGRALAPAVKQVDPKNIKSFNVLEGKSELPNSCLVLWGEKSGLPLRYSPQLHRAFPRHQERYFSGATHPLSLSRLEEVKAIADFLDGQFSRQP